MPRPTKWRRVCCLPQNNRYGPLTSNQNITCDLKDNIDDNNVEFCQIQMTIDEYETIRLIDLEGLTQEECSKQMNVARTTVQGIYIEARKKLAESLVNGKILHIEGGEYRLCGENNTKCIMGCKKDNKDIISCCEKNRKGVINELQSKL